MRYAVLALAALIILHSAALSTLGLKRVWSWGVVGVVLLVSVGLYGVVITSLIAHLR